MSYIISSVEPSHFDAWLAFRQAVYTGMDRASHLKEMELFFKADDKECFLALDANGAVCGMVEVTLRNIVDGCLTSPVGYIEGIYVCDGHRGHGQARLLTERAEHWCRSQGCQEIATDAELDNVDAQRYHEHMGFQETYRVVEYRKPL